MNKRSIQEASADYVPTPVEGTHSHFLVEFFAADGTKKYSSGHVHNLTTDTATGYTNRRDWQSKALGGGLPPVATMTGTASASGTTSLTASGATFPTSGQGLSGQIVVVGPNASGVGAISYGIILSNTGTGLVLDQWYSAGTGAL